jgi:hypothetical protein
MKFTIKQTQKQSQLQAYHILRKNKHIGNMGTQSIIQTKLHSNMFTINNIKKRIQEQEYNNQLQKQIKEEENNKETQPKMSSKIIINKRCITPTYNMIDLHNDINTNMNCDKTIVHVYDYNLFGFGDYLRGSILLAQYAKTFNINFKMDVSRHNMSKCLINETKILSTKEKIKEFHYIGKENNDNILYLFINNFINSNETTLYLSTNFFYNINLVTDDIKNYINSFLIFKQEYYDITKELFNLQNYNVLHIRCTDDNFNTDFEDNYLLTEIIKLQLNYNTIIISNNYTLKKKINKLFGFYFIDKQACHTAKINDYTELELTIIEYIILSKSSNTYCISYYHHGSGFSEQCSVLHNIPYNIMCLDNTHMKTHNTQLLLNYNANLIDNIFITNNVINHIDDTNYNNISFITLTNTGYIDYTTNCLQSLININMKKQLKVYCVGKEGYSILKNKDFMCELINDEDATSFQTFRVNNWSNITYYKFEIIYNNLLNNEYVCITDGDIVYENKIIFDYLLSNIEDNDLLIQSEGINCNDVCSGFMFIKSNEHTISIFNPENIKQYRNTKGWDDQVYINSIKNKLKYKKLPLHIFPTGQYYYEYNKNIQPYLIHFNWIIGHEKKNKMIEYNKWYTDKKIKICQHGTDGFGHQLEGMLRLLSLSLHNKADYQYNYDKLYMFEHNNVKIDKITQYFKESLNIITNKKNEYINVNNYKIILKEQRSFDEILKNDNDIENTIYCYDGVSSKIPNELPSNFEEINEFEKSLPKLREAFVTNNIYLPQKSYDNTLINVCCHIRLGDAVGTRTLDNDNLFNVIKQFQKFKKYRVIIHTNGDLSELQCENTIIYYSNTDVLQVLSDFVYADILVINYSSLSIAAHLLADHKQNVICPTNAGPTFKHRILNKCITTNDVLNKFI